MIKLIIKQANWGVAGSIFGFFIGFFVKIYLIDIIGVEQWGKYVSAHAFSGAISTIISFGIPWVIVKYIPQYIDNDLNSAKQLIRKILHYSILMSFVFLILIYFLAPVLDVYLYKEINNFSLILLVTSINVPISILMGIIIALYRSAFKIKEIMLYGTFIIVPLRAMLTYFIFMYTDNILYFIGIEIFTTFISLSLLFYLFNKNVFPILFVKKDIGFKIDSEITGYAKKMYAISLVTFFAGESLSLILSFMLPTFYIGVYSILLSISGVTLFLINNLNTIFAPAISKLYSENRMGELESLFKKTTFIINFLAIPFIISIIIFSKDILYLYDDTGTLVKYAPYLYIIMFGRIVRLLVGGAGSILVMANLEKYELKLQFFKVLFINILAILFISNYKLLAVVILFVLFSLLAEIYRIIIIYIKLKIHPFSTPLYLLVLFSIPFMYIGMTHELDFKIFHFFLIPILLYCFYALIFLKEIKSIYLDFLNKD